MDLTRPYPISLASLYRPTVLGDPRGLDRSALTGGIKAEDGPHPLRWWVDRLNVLYSHTADPTRFTDTQGRLDAVAQTAWMVTLGAPAR